MRVVGHRSVSVFMLTQIILGLVTLGWFFPMIILMMILIFGLDLGFGFFFYSLCGAVFLYVVFVLGVLSIFS